MRVQANAYKKNQINTTSSENLVLMLYDGACKDIRKAIIALDSHDIQGANHYLLHAQNIVSELMAGINFAAGEIANKLFGLYEYMHYRLIEANLKKERQAAEEVLGMVEELRNTWMQAMKNEFADAPNNQQKNFRIG